MSLYTLSAFKNIPDLSLPEGLTLAECGDTQLLAALCAISREEAIRRLANDHLAFVASVNGQPAAFGWMARGKARIGELNHEFVLPERQRYLWNFRTLPAFRGLGIYPALLQFIIQYEQPKADRFWIIHAPENKASLKGIVKAGFQYAGKLFTDTSGNIQLEREKRSAIPEDVFEALGFPLSTGPSASCWNCSSPYLKNKKEACCCTSAGETCSSATQRAVA